MSPEHGPNERLEPLDRPAEFPAIIRNIAVAKSLKGVGGGVSLMHRVDELELSVVELHESERQLCQTRESVQPLEEEEEGQEFHVADRGWQSDSADSRREDGAYLAVVFWVKDYREVFYLSRTFQVKKVVLGNIRSITKFQSWCCSLIRFYLCAWLATSEEESERHPLQPVGQEGLVA